MCLADIRYYLDHVLGKSCSCGLPYVLFVFFVILVIHTMFSRLGVWFLLHQLVIANLLFLLQV